MKSIFTKSNLNRRLLTGFIPFNLNKPFQKLGIVPENETKYVWNNNGGIMGNIKIDMDSYKDRPLDLSYYMLMRTKEKMVLEARIKDKLLVLKP